MIGSVAISTFKIYYDRITSFSAPGYNDDEILIFLNSAQDEFVKERTFGKNFQPPAFEDNQKRVADISPLITIVTDIVTASDTTYGNSYKLLKETFPTLALLWIVNVQVKCTRSGYPVIATAQFIDCDLIKSEDAGKFRSSDVNKPHFINPKWFQDLLNLWFIADEYTTMSTEANITYVREPKPIIAASTEFDGTWTTGIMSLNPIVHQEIVDIAVRQALQVQQDPRLKTKVEEQMIRNN